MSGSEPITALVGHKGTYRLGALAGEGAIGAVYRSTDVHRGELVAIKRLTTESADAKLRFAREVSALLTLQHDAVVPLLDWGEDEDGPWLAMPFIQGSTLKERIAQGPLSETETRALALRLAGGLAAIHERGITHRDLKPANVLLPDGDLTRALLADFGLARHVDDPTATRTGVAVGTPAYMAPEQARGERSVSASADVFALGAVLYECAAGRPPFRGTNALAVLAKLLTLRPEPLRALAPWSAGSFGALVDRMLRRAKEERPQDAGEVLRVLTGLPPQNMRGESTASELSDTELKPATLLVARVSTHLAPTDAATASDIPADLEVKRWAEACERFGGRPDLTTGSFLFAVFCGSTVATDQAAMAARAGLAVYELAPHARVALATGTALVSDAGAEEITADAAQNAVTLLEADTSPGVYLDAATRGLLGQKFLVDESSANGNARLRERVDEPRPGREVRGRAVPVVGRDLELASLELLVAHAEQERAPLVATVIAAAGGGKSTLRSLLGSRLAHKQGTRLLRASADALNKDTPYAVLAELIRARFDLGADVSLEHLRQRLGEQIVALGLPQELARDLAMPFGVVEAVGSTDPFLAKRRLVTGVAEWFAAEHRDDARADAAGGRTIVILLDDLQWADAASLSVLEGALLAAPLPIAVIGFARPEIQDRRPRTFEALAPREIMLPKLDPRAAERLLRAALDDRKTSSLALAPIIAAADGNPLYLEELARVLPPGEAVRPLATGSVLAMLQARCAAQAPQQRTLLRLAAAIGNTFATDVLAEVMDAPHDAAFEAALDGLVRDEFLERHGAVGLTSTLSFRHTVMREAAYSTLPDEDRGKVHARTYAAEKRRGVASASELASHAEAAGLRDTAAMEHVRAAQALLAADDLVASLAAVHRALGLEPPSSVAAEAKIIGAIAAFFTGDMGLALTWTIEGVGASSIRSALVIRAIGYMAAIVGHAYPPARPPALEAGLLALTDHEFADEEAPALAEALALSIQVSAGLFPQDRAWVDKASARLEALYAASSAGHATRAWGGLGLGWGSYYLGDTPRAARWAAAAATHFQAIDDARNLVATFCLWARAVAMTGEPSAVLAHAQRALDLAAPIGGFPLFFAQLHRASAVADLRARGLAVSIDQQAIEGEVQQVLAILQGSTYVSVEARTALASLAMHRDQDEALDHARHVLAAAGDAPITATAHAIAIEAGDHTDGARARQLVEGANAIHHDRLTRALRLIDART